MTKTFTFESNHFSTNDLCNRIEITINITARSDDESNFEFESIFDETANCERELESFPADEVTKIEFEANALTDENAGEAYQDYLEAAGDRLYDEWKDRD